MIPITAFVRPTSNPLFLKPTNTVTNIIPCNDIESSLDYKSERIQELRKNITELEQQIISDGTSEAQRASLLETVKGHQGEISYLEAEVFEFTRNKIILIDRLHLHEQQAHY